jgi:probable F420-dependent oxidoreductase
MDFGLVMQPHPPVWRIVDWARQAELGGFSHFWTFDSHLLWQEPNVIYSQVLSATHTMRAGPMVTNPITRDPTVTASTFATLNTMFGNRKVVAIGRGDSAVRVLNGRPSTVAQLRSAVETIQGLANGHEVAIGDSLVRLPWAAASRLPVYIGAYGPRMLELVGQVGDGLILQVADLHVVEWAIGRVRSAAVAAGRDPDSLEYIVAAPAYVGDDLTDQIERSRWFGAMVGNHVADIVTKYGSESGAPKALTDYIAGRTGYDYNQHGRPGNTEAEFVPDEIVERFCLLGPPAAHIAKLEALADLGVTQFGLYFQHLGHEATLQSYADVIIPAVNRPPATKEPATS